ncbi:non-homologous end-joining DNA ligase [Mobilicoccus pelagius]|nr:non-homologous end-joining DNA ligase [Mobilicoccus pelagius]
MRPMLATFTDSVPEGSAWVHEVKWDGWRVVTEIRGGALHLTSRSGRDITASFPELGGLVLPDLVLDGEIVALDESGVPSLHALADRISGPVRAGRARPRPVTVMLFDVMALGGRDLTGEPWAQRRALLEALAPSLEHDRWAVPEVYDDGALLLDVTAQNGLEGVVSKRRDSRYLPGERSPYWLKRPHRTTRSVVVGGWREETGAHRRLGAVLVGVPRDDGRLDLLGRVGSGLAGEAGRDLLAHLAPLAAEECPFADVPREDAAGARWLRPETVVDVESLGLAAQGRLRQPTYRGLRPDLTSADVTADVADAAAEPATSEEPTDGR